jgi:transcription elongation factor GreB
MSKAFTREGGSGEDEDLDLDQDSGQGLGQGQGAEGGAAPGKPGQRLIGGDSGKNYITPGGLARLKAELRELLTVERPKLVETVAWAASNGDRSENADYIYGKRRLREIDRRLRFLHRRLDAAAVVDPAAQKSDRVLFGATVTLKDEDGRERRYAIVGIDEADAKAGKISWISPLAQALLQAKQGDEIVFRSPKGEEEIEIVCVEYKPIE